jgi:hypothetical protein
MDTHTSNFVISDDLCAGGGRCSLHRDPPRFASLMCKLGDTEKHRCDRSARPDFFLQTLRKKSNTRDRGPTNHTLYIHTCLFPVSSSPWHTLCFGFAPRPCFSVIRLQMEEEERERHRERPNTGEGCACVCVIHISLAEFAAHCCCVSRPHSEIIMYRGDPPGLRNLLLSSDATARRINK